MEDDEDFDYQNVGVRCDGEVMGPEVEVQTEHNGDFDDDDDGDYGSRSRSTD